MRHLLLVLSMCLAPALATAQSLDDAAVSRFADRLAQGARAGECEAVARMFDVRALTARALTGLPMRPADVAEIATETRNALVAPGGLLAELCNRSRIRYRGRGTKDGRDVARFVAFATGDRHSFLDVTLAMDSAGTVTATDVFRGPTGRWLSDETRDLTLLGIGGASPAFLRLLTQREALLTQNGPLIGQIMDAAREGNVSAQRALISRLPEALRSDRSVLFLQLDAATNGHDAATMNEVIEVLLRLFPEDVATLSVALEAHGRARRHAASMDVLSRLERLSGTDPYFDYCRGLLLNVQGQNVEARASLVRAAQGDPDAVATWMLVLKVAAALDRPLDAARAYQSLVRLSAVPASFATDPAYARIRAAQAFRAIVPNAPP